MQEPHVQLAAIEAELAKQDAEWADAQAQLLALGEVELSLDPDVVAEIEGSTTLTYAGSLPVGLPRM